VRRRKRPKQRVSGRRPGATHVAFAWYTPQEWARLRATADDQQALDDNYEAWLASAEEAMSSLQARGVDVVRFPIDVSAAAAWARGEGRPFNSSARADYVATMASRKGKRP
jgi:hypothetical protein